MVDGAIRISLPKYGPKKLDDELLSSMVDILGSHRITLEEMRDAMNEFGRWYHERSSRLRPKDAASKMERLTVAATELMEAITAVAEGDMGRDLDEVLGEKHAPSVLGIYELSDGPYVPGPINSDLDGTLSAIARAGTALKEDYSRPGRPPQWLNRHVVKGLILMYEEVTGKPATATEGGDFLGFVGYAMEIVTGEYAELPLIVRQEIRVRKSG